MRARSAPEALHAAEEAITLEYFEILRAEIPELHRILVLVAIETGVRWGELAALRPGRRD